jgi:hypothetical protein
VNESIVPASINSPYTSLRYFLLFYLQRFLGGWFDHYGKSGDDITIVQVATMWMRKEGPMVRHRIG